MEAIEADWLLATPGTGRADERRAMRIAIDGARIAAIEPIDSSDPTGTVAAGLPRAASRGAEQIVLPGLANAHDHARTFAASAAGGFDRPLETLLLLLGAMPAVDPYVAAATALGRAALGGAGRVMIHYTRWQRPEAMLEEAAAVRRAARDIGVQVGFAIAMSDRRPIAYADNAAVLAALPAALREPVAARLDRPPRSVAAWMAIVDEIADALHAPDFNVQYGPTAVHWCSHDMLGAIADASARTGRQVHMHLLESPYQRAWADRHFGGRPGGVVGYLRDIGLLGPRLTLAHGTWCRPDELALIAASGATVSLNAGSNLSLRSGIAPGGAMAAHACSLAMGLDGLTLGEDDDALRELRLLHALHRGWGFAEGGIDAARAWRLAAEGGRFAVSGLREPAALVPGARADLLVLDGRRLLADRAFDDVAVADMVLARATARDLRAVYVEGRRIVADGRLCGVDHAALSAELHAQLRAGAAAAAPWREVARALDRALARFYLGGGHLAECG